MPDVTRTTIAGLMLVAMVVLAACGSGSTAPSPPLTHASATAAPTPTPTPDLTAAAATAYLAAATTGNAAAAAVSKNCKSASSFAAVTQCWRQYEAVDRAFLTTIFGIAYPPSMKGDVDAQIAAETKVVSDEAAMVANVNDNAAYAADTADGNAEAAAANIVRHDLGLPQVPLSTP